MLKYTYDEIKKIDLESASEFGKIQNCNLSLKTIKW